MKAIELLIEAEELGLKTYPFRLDRNGVFLVVEDSEGEDFTIKLAEFKTDFSDKRKIYD